MQWARPYVIRRRMQYLSISLINQLAACSFNYIETRELGRTWKINCSHDTHLTLDSCRRKRVEQWREGNRDSTIFFIPTVFRTNDYGQPMHRSSSFYRTFPIQLVHIADTCTHIYTLLFYLTYSILLYLYPCRTTLSDRQSWQANDPLISA